MTSADYRALARQKMQGRTLNLVVASLIYQCIISILVSTGLGFIIVGPLEFGFALYVLAYIRGYEPSFSLIFEGFNTKLADTIIAELLIGLYVFLWSLLFIIPGIIKAYSYSMTMYILADNPNYTWKEAMSESERIMNGNKFRLFCLEFSFIGWYILSCFTFGLLLIWLIPYTQAATAEFYESIKAPVYFAGDNQNGAEEPAQNI